ncbi:MAG: NUDIX domain-containing protein [Pseudomonadota bacterium]
MQVESTETLYEGWGRFLIATLRDAAGTALRREVEDHGDAVAVLPYDTERGTVLLVRQTRTPMLVRGEPDRFYEALAGRVEPGEPVEETARREAMEECGVRLTTLEPLGGFYAMPAVSTERITLFLAPYRAADRVAAGGGLAEEGEDIDVVEVPLDDLWARGFAALADMKTALLVLALREKLRR